MVPAESVTEVPAGGVPGVFMVPVDPPDMPAVSVTAEVAAVSAALLSFALHASVASIAPMAAIGKKDRIFIWFCLRSGWGFREFQQHCDRAA
jgi:hypothetical protein